MLSVENMDKVGKMIYDREIEKQEIMANILARIKRDSFGMQS